MVQNMVRATCSPYGGQEEGKEKKGKSVGKGGVSSGGGGTLKYPSGA